jgi:uncharacterized protein YndB with AHSA1/START domain
MRFVRTVGIQAAPAQVWQVMSDVEAWPSWTASVTSVHLLDAGPLRVGARAVVRQPRLPVATWRVTDLVPGPSFTWVARGPGLRTTGRHEVVPDGDWSTATLTLDQEGPLGGLVGRLTRDLTERYLALEADGLKRRSEGQQA